MDILQELQNRILFCDGGMGSLLQEAGLKPGELPGTWNITHPEELVKIHKAYLEAGADIVTTNTFGVDRLKYNKNTEFQLEPVIRAAVANAKEAIRQSGKQAWIGLDMGPTGKLLKPMGDLAFEDCCAIYREVVEIGADAGADFILIETMSDSYETKAAVLAAKEGCDLPIFVTVTFDERGKLLTGGSPASIVAMLEGLGVDVLGMNCGLGPVQMKEILKDVLEVSSIPVMINPNAGLPRSENGKTVYDIDAAHFAKTEEEIVDMGARIVGGCCGTTPEHIRMVAERCRDKQPVPVTKKNRTVVSSFAQAVEIGKNPVIIGERINPTGKSKFKQALRDHNLEYILREAITQQENGAAVLDVNVGLPEIDEVAMMREVVQELQAVTELPLQIDTTDTEAMEQALRIYNGKALINSVNGKQEVMDAVFPLVKHYGGTVVALTIDEEGIPATADGRMAIARKICAEAEKYGIQKKDIVIDALCMTISSEPTGALVTLETVRRVRQELGCNTILGVSNISFGLPQREIVNSNFFTMAMQSGLTAAIINPNSAAMMRSYYSYRALAALDEHCGDYIEQAARLAIPKAGAGGASGAGAAGSAGSGAPAAGAAGASGSADTGSQASGPEHQLTVSVERGLKEQAASAAGELLKTMDSLTVINSCMIPALDKVGKGFEAGNVFLPQLLMSAEAAKSAFEVIKNQMESSGEAGEKKDKIVLPKAAKKTV